MRDPTLAGFNYTIYPATLKSPKKPTKRTLESWKSAIHNKKELLDFNRLRTPANLEKAEISLPLCDDDVLL